MRSLTDNNPNCLAGIRGCDCRHGYINRRRPVLTEPASTFNLDFAALNKALADANDNLTKSAETFRTFALGVTIRDIDDGDKVRVEYPDGRSVEGKARRQYGNQPHLVTVGGWATLNADVPPEGVTVTIVERAVQTREQIAAEARQKVVDTVIGLQVGDEVVVDLGASGGIVKGVLSMYDPKLYQWLVTGGPDGRSRIIRERDGQCPRYIVDCTVVKTAAQRADEKAAADRKALVDTVAGLKVGDRVAVEYRDGETANGLVEVGTHRSSDLVVQGVRGSKVGLRRDNGEPWTTLVSCTVVKTAQAYADERKAAEAEALRRTVAGLKVGDHVEVTYLTEGVKVGTLRMGKHGYTRNDLVVDVNGRGWFVRNADGSPFRNVTSVKVVAPPALPEPPLHSIASELDGFTSWQRYADGWHSTRLADSKPFQWADFQPGGRLDTLGPLTVVRWGK